jgi:nucleotide-binding universal stress UspA family protein
MMKILIAYDGSTFADIAVDDLQLAGLPQCAEALVVSAVEPDRYATDTFGTVEAISQEWTERIESATYSAEIIANRVQTDFPRWDVKLETPSGHAAAMILDRAESWSADLIVLGTHGRSGLGRLLLGSVSLKVVREAPCSVRVVRATRTPSGSPLRILIGDDGSPEAEVAVREVCARSWPAGAEACVLAVPQTLAPVDAESFALAAHSLLAPETFLESDRKERKRVAMVTERAASRLEDAGLHVASLEVKEGSPSDVLLHQARIWPADMLFVGACGLGRVERLLLGSVSEALVKHAPCTVEVVRT